MDSSSSSDSDMPITAGKVKAGQAVLTWHIENIHNYCNESEIESPEFMVVIGKVRTKWKLLLTLKVEGDESKDDKKNLKYAEIYLTNLSNRTIRAAVDFEILNSFMRRRKLKFSTELNVKNYEPHESYGNSAFIRREYLFNNIIDDCTIICTIIEEDFVKIEVQTRKDHVDQLKRLEEFDNFTNLLNNKDFSDVVISVQGKEIYAHKNFLATKSSVFNAMFTHDMSESYNNRVEISDLSYSTICAMLEYIYTGVITNPYDDHENFYKELLIATEKYDIDSLKLQCQEKLSEHVAVANVFELLNFSDTHNASYLKKKVLEFIVNNGEDITALPSFKKDCNELHADVYSEVFQALVIKRRKVE